MKLDIFICLSVLRIWLCFIKLFGWTTFSSSESTFLFILSVFKNGVILSFFLYYSSFFPFYLCVLCECFSYWIESCQKLIDHLHPIEDNIIYWLKLLPLVEK